MSPRPARCTQADLQRAIKAAKREGWHRVELTAAGKIIIADAPPKDDQSGDDNEWDSVA